MFSSSTQLRQLLILSLGMGLGAVVTLVAVTSPMLSSAPATQPESTTPKVLYWYDPMVPAQHFDKPGKSPFMDMELVPKYAESGPTTNTLQIDPAQVQNLGMRTTKVLRMRLHPQHDLPGTLRFNERNQAVIQLRAGGFVEKAWPLAPGDKVAAGQPIATFYVPEWLNIQNELLASKALNSPRLLETLRTRLRLQGMPDTLINQIERTGKPETRITITAPIYGVIEALEIKTGMSLSSGETLVRITNIDSMWLDVAIPEAEASGFRPGNSVSFYTATASTTPIIGEIDSLLPSAHDATRTLTARVVLPNPNGFLKPGMSGRVVLSGAQSDTGLLIPTEAVIRTGKRTLVMVADTDHHFRPVSVTLGAEIGDQTLVIDGLEEGQEVVVSGQFLLDSEASLMGIEPEPLPSSAALITSPDITTHQASGRIVSLSDKDIGLKHGDFVDQASKKVSMPGMTMTYPLANTAVAKGFKVGDSVRVSAHETEGTFVIDSLESETNPPAEKKP